MERRRWETAICCLEIALHPNTSDDEAIAGVNGFRRIAAGTPLSQVCLEFAGGGLVTYPAEWREQLDRLNRENLDLRRKLETAAEGQIATLERLDKTRQYIRELRDELEVAQRQAAAAEERLADLSSAYARVTNGLKHDVVDLRLALEQTRAISAETKNTATPFREMLENARQGTQMDTRYSTSLTRGRKTRPQAAGPGPHRPWTA